MRALVLLRPEPGLSRSADRARAIGLTVIQAALFAIEPVDWEVPDPRSFDGLVLTSANAVRHSGAGLTELRGLPVAAVGDATADAAREAGLDVRQVADAGVDQLLASLPADIRLLHLCGEDFYAPAAARQSIEQRVVYRAAAINEPQLPELADAVVAVHSARAAARLADLCRARGETIIVAISKQAAQACGTGWEYVAIVDAPRDSALLALAARLCQEPVP